MMISPVKGDVFTKGSFTILSQNIQGFATDHVWDCLKMLGRIDEVNTL
jgi:hypothetical protein